MSREYLDIRPSNLTPNGIVSYKSGQPIIKFDIIMVPKKVFFTKGVGRHKDKLRSFELALRDAGIERCNLVYVSSILPPKCKITPRSRAIKQLQSYFAILKT